MTSHETAGVLRRALAALGSALKRGILGKSAHDYTKQFTGSDAYWDRVIAAQQGWPRQETPQPDAVRIRSSSDVVMRSGPSYAAAAQVNGSSPSWFGLWRINRDKAASGSEPNGTQQARESQTNRLCGL